MTSDLGEVSESRAARRYARGAACWCVLIGGVTLLGYGLGLRDLARILPAGPVMQPATAVCLLLLAVALWLVAPRHAHTARRRAGAILALSAALIGALILADHTTGRRIGIDVMVFPGRLRAWAAADGAAHSPILAGLGSMVFGLALALLDARPRQLSRPARLLVPAAGLIPIVALTSYAYELTYLRGSDAPTAISITAAISFAILWVSILVCRPELPPLRVFARRGIGALLLRRVAPGAILTVLLVGIMLTALRGSNPSSAEGLLVTVGILTLLGALYVVFTRVNTTLEQADTERERLITELREERDLGRTVLHSLRDGVMTLDANGTVLQVSPRWSEITGFPAAAAVGSRPPYPWWLPHDIAKRQATLAATLETGVDASGDIVIRRRDGTRADVEFTVTAARSTDERIRMLVVTYSESTDDKRADAQQRRLTRELDHFFTNSNDLLCIFDSEGRFLRTNPVWERTFGFTAMDLLGRPYGDFVHPDDVARSAAETAGLFTHGTPITSLDNRYRCHDGSYRWLNWNAAADLDDGMIYASARDVTAGREADRAQASLAAIVDSTTDAIIGSTLDGIIISWNPAAVRYYGYAAEDVIGRSMRLLLPADRAEETSANLRQVTTGEPVVSHDTMRLRKDGTRIHVALTVSPIRDGNGTVVGAASTSRDLTAQDMAEERFRRLIEGAPVALVIVDRDGTIVLANNHTNEMFGYPAGELVGRPIELLIPQRSRHAHLPYRREYLADPQPRLMGAGRELVALRNDGSEFPVEISLAPMDTDQGTLVSAAILDLTTRHQIEKASADARDEALAAAQLKSQFVAMVSHEIRTPMNGVIGLTRLLLQTPLKPAQRRYAEAIRTSGRALLAIINDILDFSKIEAGKIELVDADFDLHVLLDDVVQVAAETGRAKDLEVLGHYPPDLVRAVHGDAGRLRQILLNLLGNAVKFTERGEVVLRTGAAADSADGRPQLTFAVTDTGIGIAPADQIDLFEPFSQVDAAANRQFGGTGLGLTICHQLIGLMGGRLGVDSEPGHGSTFAFTIPLIPRPDLTERTSHLHVQFAGERVLIVDDNTTSRDLLTEHVEAWGMTAAVAENAQGALDQLRQASTRQHGYDIALIDQSLPGLTGIDLAELIADDPDLATVRLILLTSGSYRDDEVAAAAGAIAMLAKPVGPSTLYDCLVEVLAVDETAEDATRHSPAESDHGIVLLAEDNDINQLVAIETLAELGYRTDVAHNGLEALQLAHTKPYLAILMDCQMPEMDGYTATVELRRREDADHHLPIIAMTAGAFAEDRQRCLQAGMDDYLAKPIDPDELRTALERWATAPTTDRP